MFKTQKNFAPLRDFYTKEDLWLVVLLCLMLLGWAGGRPRGELVVIEGPRASWQLPLFGPEELVEVEGPLGKTKVVVGGGRAQILSSPCPDHTCVNWGKIRSGGQALICAPNHVVVRILGKGKYHALTH